jgi:hypothetical protein
MFFLYSASEFRRAHHIALGFFHKPAGPMSITEHGKNRSSAADR